MSIPKHAESQPRRKPRLRALVPSTRTLLARAESWTKHEDDELRRRAVTACRDRDTGELWGLTEAYLLHQGHRGAWVSPRTLSTYETGIRQLVAAWQGESLLHPSRNSGSRWLAQLEDCGLSPSTVQVRLAAARCLYRALRWAGATENDPWRDARAPKDPTPAWEKRAPYSPEELSALIAAADPETRAILLLGSHGGLRISEILGLRWSNVSLNRRNLKVKGKGQKTRTVLLSLTLIEALEGLPRPTPLVISGVRTDMGARKRIAKLCQATGVPHRGIHALRHSAGTRLYHETGSLDAAARHLGHSSIETARIYAKWADTTLNTSVGNW